MSTIKNLIHVLEQSQGIKIFQTFYNSDGEDVLRNGDLSCAYYVSTILTMVRLIDGVSCTVSGLLNRMDKAGWYILDGKPSNIPEGAIIVWNPVTQGDSEHKHIGFYLGNDQVISNRSSLRVPGIHELIYSGLDKNQENKKVSIDAIFYHEKLKA